MKAPVYLSVDIDFFNYNEGAKRHGLLSRIISHGEKVGMVVVGDHQNLLPSIHKMGDKPLHLINMDKHSDLCNLPGTKQGIRAWCGDWVNHLYTNQRYKYTWIHPLNGGARCDGSGPDLHIDSKKRFGWEVVRKTTDLRGWQQADFVGIALSYDYCYELYNNIIMIVRAIPRKYFVQDAMSHLNKDPFYPKAQCHTGRTLAIK